MNGLPARPPLLNIPTARHFENWLSINMVAKRGSQGPSAHNGASKAAAIQPAQTAIIIPDRFLHGAKAKQPGCIWLCSQPSHPAKKCRKAAKTSPKNEKTPSSSSVLTVIKIKIKCRKGRQHATRFVFLPFLC